MPSGSVSHPVSAWAVSSRPMTTEWRSRWTHAQTRGRTIERQATGLRLALIRVADGDAAHSEVLAATKAIREQLALAEEWAISAERKLAAAAKRSST